MRALFRNQEVRTEELGNWALEGWLPAPDSSSP